MIAVLRYGNGQPFRRQEMLQGNLGIPLSDSTQWDIVNAQVKRAEPVKNWFGKQPKAMWFTMTIRESRFWS